MWFKDARKTYNLAMGYVLRHRLHEKVEDGLNLVSLKKKLRSMFVTKNGLISTPHMKMIRTPKVIRETASDDVVTVLKTFATKCKKRQELRQKFPNARTFKKDLRFNPGFKGRDMKHDSIGTVRQNWKVKDDWTLAWYPRKNAWRYKCADMGPLHEDLYGVPMTNNPFDPLRPKKRFSPTFSQLEIHQTRHQIIGSAPGPVTPEFLDRDLKVHYRHGRYYLIVPRYEVVDPSHLRQPGERDTIVALDQGVRKFITAYSPQGKAEMIASDFSTKVKHVQKRLYERRVQSRSQASSFLDSKSALTGPGRRKKKRYLRTKMRRAKQRVRRLEDRVQNIVKDVHYKTAHHILRNYKTIILPDFNSHQCRQSRQLHPSTKRVMQAMSFGKFRTRFEQCATFYKDTTVLRGSEAYTSKQCLVCGYLNDKLGGGEIFQCKKCNSGPFDRDVHGAANILLRFIKCGTCSGSGCEDCDHITV